MDPERVNPGFRAILFFANVFLFIFVISCRRLDGTFVPLSETQISPTKRPTLTSNEAQPRSEKSTPSPRSTQGSILLQTPIKNPPFSPLECLPKSATPEFGIVEWVSSGDTLVVNIKGVLWSVHLLGVLSAPVFPRISEFGPPAATQSAQLANGKVVRLITDPPETVSSAGLERYVVIQGEEILLNYELVRLGLAKYNPDLDSISCAKFLMDAQATAQHQSIGMWEPTGTCLPTATPRPTSTSTITPVSSDTPTPNGTGTHETPDTTPDQSSTPSFTPSPVPPSPSATNTQPYPYPY